MKSMKSSGAGTDRMNEKEKRPPKSARNSEAPF